MTRCSDKEAFDRIWPIYEDYGVSHKTSPCFGPHAEPHAVKVKESHYPFPNSSSSQIRVRSISTEDSTQISIIIPMMDNSENGSSFEDISIGTTQTKPSSINFDAGSDKAARYDEVTHGNDKPEKDAKFDEVFAEYVQKHGRERVLEIISNITPEGKAPSHVKSSGDESSELNLAKHDLPDHINPSDLDTAPKDVKILRVGDRARTICPCPICIDDRLKQGRENFSLVSDCSHPNT
jgi:hypothetical protein